MTVPVPSFRASGPVFDGRAQAAADAFLQAAKEDIAEEGVNEVRMILSTALKNPTGFYESQIQTDRAREDIAITDGGVVYGPWLEGVSQRNQSTRFKGYAHFRRASQALQDRAARIAQATLPPFLARMQ